MKKKALAEDEISAPFMMNELLRAQANTKMSSPGKDEVCYIMIKHLPDDGLKVLMLYNKVWEEGRLQISWKEAMIVPIRKPGKDPNNPIHYRPIA